MERRNTMGRLPEGVEHLKPSDIERRSFEIITKELGDRRFDPLQEPIIKRCIHTSADFDYADNLCFSKDAVQKAMEAIVNGASIVTDTAMAMAGINKAALHRYGGRVYNFIGDEDVAASARERGVTRSAVCMEKAAGLQGTLIFAIGNAPTALLRVRELVEEGALAPALVIGVPVGFVNVEISKELLMRTDVPYIVAKGRKGGSNIAAAICNSLLYMLREREG